jgi:phosphatidylinositol-bisphosphatase
LLQWGGAFLVGGGDGEDDATTAAAAADPPRPEGSHPARGEDWDSAPAGELHFPGGFSTSSPSQPPPQSDASFPSAPFADSQLSAASTPPNNAEAASALLGDPSTGRLWSATADGRVACWDTSIGSGRAARFLHAFTAHRGAKVKAMALTPWGALVTGARNGSVKMWAYGGGGGSGGLGATSASSSSSAPPVRWRTLRKPAGGVGGGGGGGFGATGGGGGGGTGFDATSGGGSDPHSRVVRVAVSSGGRVLWTAGRETLALWSAHSGQHLGTLRAPAGPVVGGGGGGSGFSDGGGARRPSYPSSYSSGLPPTGFEDPYGVNPRTGLPAQLIAGAFVGGAAAGPDGGGGGFGETILYETRGGGGGYGGGGYGGGGGDHPYDATNYEDDEDPAAVALKAAGKAAAKAGRFLGKLGKKIADGAAAAAEKAAAAAATAGGEGSDFYGGGASPHYARPLTPERGGGGFGGGGGGLGGDTTTNRQQQQQKDEHYGGIKDLVALEDGSMLVAYRRGALERFSEAGQLLWCSLSSSSSPASSSSTAPLLPSLLRSGVTALAARPGGGAWVGCTDGVVVALEPAAGSAGATELVVAHAWRAHLFPIRALACCCASAAAAANSAGSSSSSSSTAAILYTLARDGSIKGWPASPLALAASSPPSALLFAAPRKPSSSSSSLSSSLDAEGRAWRRALLSALERRSIRVLVGTWNVAEGKPSRASLRLWLGQRSAGASIVAVALQEVEMGTGSVAAAALFASGVVGRAKLESGTAAGQAWAAELHACLDCGQQAWERVGMRQMSGVLAVVFARKEVTSRGHAGDVATDAVPCGVLGLGGNKGGTAVSLSLFRRRVVFVSSHFAAHQDAVEARNGDYAKIVSRLHFHNSSAAAAAARGGGGGGGGGASGGGVGGGFGGDNNNSLDPFSSANNNNDNNPESDDWGPGMRDAELLVWAGDFNYRIDAAGGALAPEVPRPLSPRSLKQLAARDPQSASLAKAQAAETLYRHVLECVARPSTAPQRLLPGDQLTRERARGNVFRGLAEAPLRFLPTYKFEKGQQSCYDMGEKKRVPAWTDRVLFRGSVPVPVGGGGSGGAASSSSSAPPPADAVVAVPEDEVNGGGVGGAPAAYGSVMDVYDSDHKPVYLALSVTLPSYDQAKRRALARRALGRLAAIAASSSSGAAASPFSSSSAATALVVEPPSLTLRDGEAARVRVRLAGVAGGEEAAAAATWRFADALPLWLEASPAWGSLPPEGADVTLRAAFGRQQMQQASVYSGGGGAGEQQQAALRVVASSSAAASSAAAAAPAGAVLVVSAAAAAW